MPNYSATLIKFRMILIDMQEDGEIFAEKHFVLNENEQAKLKLNKIIEDAKTVLRENFPESDARTCLVQLTDYLAERKI